MKLPNRDDIKYKEIEQFEKFELTECVAYEMAIRMEEVKKLLEKYEQNKGLPESKEASKLLLEKYWIDVMTLKPNTYGRFDKKEKFAFTSSAQIVSDMITICTSPNKIYTFKSTSRPQLVVPRELSKSLDVTVNASLPVDELEDYFAKIITVLKKNQAVIHSVNDVLNDFSPQDEIFKKYPKKTNAQKFADWFYIYDCYMYFKKSINETELNIYNAIDLCLALYYDGEDGLNFYGTQTYRLTILPTMKYYIDGGNYKNLLVGNVLPIKK